MKKIILGLSAILFFTFANLSFAANPPKNVTPTLYCLGTSCPTLPPDYKIPPQVDETVSTQPVNGNQPITPGQNGQAGTPGFKPDNSVTEPCETTDDASVMHTKEKHKSGGGFIEKFIKFFMWLIQYLINGGA